MRTDFTKKIERDFINMMDTWHGADTHNISGNVDQLLRDWYSHAPVVHKEEPFFSPSSLNSCPRELYLLGKGVPRDKRSIHPVNGRWQRLGTMGGDMVQRDMLIIERYYEDIIGEKPKFVFDYTDDGFPMFEEFAKKNHSITVDGETFNLSGSPDGVMWYTADDGNKYKVGLEVKSKQTTNARTSLYSMRREDESHYVQTIAYNEMFGCDYYLIFYVNYSKKSWEISEEDYEKTPDIRAFCHEFSQEEKDEVFGRAAQVRKAIKTDKPPRMDITKWTFNNLKGATARSLTAEEVKELNEEVKKLQKSDLPKFKKRQVEEAFREVIELWGGVEESEVV